METCSAARCRLSAAMVVQPDRSLPEAAELPTLTVDPEAVDVVEVPDFDSLPLPGDPCPVCGSLETWWDMLGGGHCRTM